MADFPKAPAGALTRQLQAISANGWANIQTPVREGFEAAEASTGALAAELADSRDCVRRLEARLAGMEEMLSRRVDTNARSVREEMDTLRSAVESLPSHAEVRTMASEVCGALESTVNDKTRALEGTLEEVRVENRKAFEAVQQASAGKAMLSDLEAFYPRAEAAARADLLDVENRVNKKADKDATDASLATKVSWPDMERLLREKADTSALAELDANCVSIAAFERVELGQARVVGMEEVRAFVETQTGDLQAMAPALERLIAARAKEERDAAEKGPASSITRSELPSLILATFRELRDSGGVQSEEFSPRVNAAQIQAAIAAGRESTVRTVESHLARARGVQQEELLTQEKRLRLELEESTGRARIRVEGLSRGLEQAKAELVSLLNAKAYKMDLTQGLQGKADARALESAMALSRSKVDESDYREASGRTLHALAALSAEIGGVRAEARADMERLSCRVQAKADADDVLALKSHSWNIAVAAAAEKAGAGRVEHHTTAPLGATNAASQHGGSPCPSRPQPSSSIRNSDIELKQPSSRGSLSQKGRAPSASGVATVGGGLSREEARLLIRAELKRAGISDKITREEASVQAEGCASRVLSIASKAVDATDLRLRAISERLDKSAGAASGLEIQRLSEAQSSLELRVTRSLSLGRWLWRGIESERTMPDFSAAGKAAEALSGTGVDGRTLPRIEGTTGSGRRVCGDERVSDVCDEIWVPWEAEVANASPECLQWKPGSTSLTAIVPGLYLLSCGFFSQLPFVATVYLNGDPVFSFSQRRRPAGATAAAAAAPDEPVPAKLARPASADIGPSRDESRATSEQPPPPPPRNGIHDRKSTVCLDDHQEVEVEIEPSVKGTVSTSSTPPPSTTTRATGSATGMESCAVEQQFRAPTIKTIAYRHPAGEVLATSIREFLAWPVGGVLSVKFGVTTDVSEREEERRLPIRGKAVGGGMGECGDRFVFGDEIERGAARREVPRAQGFLELKKL